MKREDPLVHFFRTIAMACAIGAIAIAALKYFRLQ
jgi:hypothetical protein